MFTGIIEAVGLIEKITPRGKDISLQIQTGKLNLADVQLGDSIASNGVCLTVVQLGASYFVADLSAETLAKSNFQSASVGQKVNLEKAMLPTTRFGGHMVSGHVDGLAKIIRREAVGRAIEFWVEAPKALAKYLAKKGSVTIDGISLTINDVTDQRFKLTIVPHTAQQTTLADATVGQWVNLEVDVIARYLERLVMGDATHGGDETQGLTLDKLAQAGFLK